MAAPTREAAGLVVDGTGGSDRSFTFTVPASLSNSVLVIATTWFGGGNSTVATAEFDGTDITGEEIGTQQSAFDSASRDGVFMAYVVNPGSGSKTVDLTYSESQGTNDCALAYWIYSGVDTDNFPDAFIDPNHEGSGGSYSGSITTTVDDCALGFFAVDFNNTGNGSISGWTRITNGDPDYAEAWVLDDAGTAGAETFTWTKSGSSFGVGGFAVPPAAGGATNQAVGLSSETDSAQAVTIRKELTAAIAEEADAALAISPARIKPVGLASETDSAQAVDRSRGVNVGLASEVDTPQPVTGSRTVAVGVATEADSAQDVAGSKSVAVGLASEADEALSVALTRFKDVGLASEADTALGVSAVGPGAVEVGLTSETDSALGITIRKETTAGQAEETDAAQSITPARLVPIGLATESDTPQAVTFRREVVIGQASETDSALQLVVVGGTDVAPVQIDRGSGSGGARSLAQAEELRRLRRLEEEELILAILTEDVA